MQNALHPILNCPSSTFSKNIKIFSAVVGQIPVTDPQNKQKRRILGLWDPSIERDTIETAENGGGGADHCSSRLAAGAAAEEGGGQAPEQPSPARSVAGLSGGGCKGANEAIGLFFGQTARHSPN